MEKMTLPEVVVNAAEQFGDAIAIQEAHQQFTFNELNALRIRFCQAFIAAGIEKGDRVAIWAPNVAEWVIAAIGLQSAGGVLVPINTRMKGSEAAFIINNSGAKLLFTVAGFLDIDYPKMLANQEMPALETIILLHELDNQTLHNDSGSLMSWRSFLAMAEQVPSSEAEQRAASVMPDDTMDIMFTSGTTGKPKAVVCAHGQNIESFITWGKLRGFRSSDNYLIISPFFYSYGYKAGWLACLIHGATISPALSFDLDKVLAQIERDRISVLSGTPSMYQSILAHPNKTVYDLSSLRLAGTGGAPVPVSLIEKIRRELGFECVGTGYGLTETCGIVTLTHADDTAELISTTSGRAMPGVEVKCIALDGTPVPVGEPGEICVRGYSLMQGYVNNPAATAETI
ncbi:MAG: AMP-binding protein, partial [Pseudomonadales bacterium]|nr:AMP-binding protein [Pseudomonadales bacterium]